MNEIQDTLMGWGVMLPDWAFWILIAIVAVLVVAYYFFPKHVREVTDKYEIPHDKVDGMVRMVAALAVRMVVLKKGIEETEKVARIQNIATTIDLLYPTTSSIRLSVLVKELEGAIAKQQKGAEILKHTQVLHDISGSIVNELTEVGEYIHDNQNDPLVNPRDISYWVGKGLTAIDMAAQIKNSQKK